MSCDKRTKQEQNKAIYLVCIIRVEICTATHDMTMHYRGCILCASTLTFHVSLHILMLTYDMKREADSITVYI